MSSRVAVAGWYGSDNLGDELILRSLVGAVRSRGAEPVVISIDPVATRRDHGVDAVAHRHPGHSPALRRTLSGCDAVVVAGGVIQSETSPWNVGFHTSRLRAAPPSLAGAALGVGVGRVSQRWDRSLAVRSLRRLRRVVVRDADSARRLRDWGLADVAVGTDPVISLQPELVTPTDTMCVILRPANRRGLRTAAAKARRMRPAPETLDRIARAIDAAAAATGLEPRFLAFQASRDNSLHTALAERLSAPAQTITPNVETVLAEVARSRLVITMRYHGAIAALLQGRRAVLVDDSPKVASLAAEAGGWARVLSLESLQTPDLAIAAAGALADDTRSDEALGALRTRLAVNDSALDDLLG